MKRATQVLSEYAAVAIRKLSQPRDAVTRQLLALERLEVVPVSRHLIRDALELSEAFTLSFWDSLILQAALGARCDVLWSKDFSLGRRYAGMELCNPFEG